MSVVNALDAAPAILDGATRDPPVFCARCGYRPNLCECAPQSAATPLPGGSGGAGTFLPRRNASALNHQPSHDRLDQFSDRNRTFHGGRIA